MHTLLHVLDSFVRGSTASALEHLQLVMECATPAVGVIGHLARVSRVRISSPCQLIVSSHRTTMLPAGPGLHPYLFSIAWAEAMTRPCASVPWKLSMYVVFLCARIGGRGGGLCQ